MAWISPFFFYFELWPYSAKWEICVECSSYPSLTQQIANDVSDEMHEKRLLQYVNDFVFIPEKKHKNIRNTWHFAKILGRNYKISSERHTYSISLLASEDNKHWWIRIYSLVNLWYYYSFSIKYNLEQALIMEQLLYVDMNIKEPCQHFERYINEILLEAWKPLCIRGITIGNLAYVELWS